MKIARSLIKTNSYILEVTDKSDPSAGTPIIYLLVEHRETNTYSDDLKPQLVMSEIELSYKTIKYPGGQGYSKMGTSGSFKGEYEPHSNSASVVKSTFFLDPTEIQGHGLGTYFLSQIVKWVKQWPDADISPVILMANQANKNNKERRNSMYENIGLAFKYTDIDKRSGSSLPIKASELIVVKTWEKNISEKTDVANFISNLLNENAMLQLDNEHRIARTKKDFDKYYAVWARPFRYAFWTRWFN